MAIVSDNDRGDGGGGGGHIIISCNRVDGGAIYRKREVGCPEMGRERGSKERGAYIRLVVSELYVLPRTSGARYFAISARHRCESGWSSGTRR